MLPGQAPGLHLADKGHEQAGAAAERIAALAKAPTAVYTSPLERTRETAAPIARALGLRVRTAPGLVEVDVGDWTEKSLTRLYRKPEWPTVQRWPVGFRFPGGESFAEMSVRAMDTILDLVAEHPGETIVAVSHADPIKAIVAAAAGMPRRPVAAAGHFALFDLGPPLHRRWPCGAVHELHGLVERAGAVVTGRPR